MRLKCIYLLLLLHLAGTSLSAQFLEDLSIGDGFAFDTTSHMDELKAEKLKDYSVIIKLNSFPRTEEQRRAFQKYMEEGGGWSGPIRITG